MTRKDYVKIADAIARASVTLEERLGDDNGRIATQVVALSIANELKRDNPSFSHAMFYRACGVQA